MDWATLLRLAYREAWKVVLDGKPLDRAIVAAQRQIDTYDVRQEDMDGLGCRPDEIASGFARLHALAQQGSALSQELVDEARRKPWRVARIQALGKALEELDEQIKVLGATREELKPIAAMFRFGKENLQGSELLPLSQ